MNYYKLHTTGKVHKTELEHHSNIFFVRRIDDGQVRVWSIPPTDNSFRIAFKTGPTGQIVDCDMKVYNIPVLKLNIIAPQLYIVVPKQFAPQLEAYLLKSKQTQQVDLTECFCS